MKITQIALVAAALLLVAGCAERRNLSPMPSISEQAKADLGRSVDCSTAEQDIAVLESERASVAKQILSGVRSVFPIAAAAAGILMGDYRDRVTVATGKYNRDLAAKIAHIKSECGLY